ncbi:methyltransferase family protein [Alteromonadaceae bacterium 2753L.S.0a.02]|nr:methyltransferase family protein [Alteromonadaceae bacterium 2753L.S.0a.02]
MPVCPLCDSYDIVEFFEDSQRLYRQCQRCNLVFVEKYFHLSAGSEKAEYDKHNNLPNDPQYQNFLSRIVSPVTDLLSPGNRVLDFGCGPGPAIATMLAPFDIAVSTYDLYFCDNRAVLQERYHAVIATEVIEHLRQPKQTLQLIWQCVAAGGVFAAMSKLVINRDAFARWHYKNDPTHICFYSEATLNWLADCWQAELVLVAKDAFFFKKSGV